MTRALVTGVGAITPIGLTVHDFWQNLTAGVSGVTRITRFDASDLPVQIAAEVKDFEPGKYMDSKGARRMSRFSQLAVAAARLAAEARRSKLGLNCLIIFSMRDGGYLNVATKRNYTHP